MADGKPLAGASKETIEAVARYLKHGDLIGDMPLEDLRLLLESKYHRGTLRDALDTLNAQNKIKAKELAAEMEAKAAKMNQPDVCGLPTPTATSGVDEWGGQKVEDLPCQLPRDHDGPCMASIPILGIAAASAAAAGAKPPDQDQQPQSDGTLPGQGQGQGESPMEYPPELDDHIRKIAREEDQKLLASEIAPAFRRIAKDIEALNNKIKENVGQPAPLMMPSLDQIKVPDVIEMPSLGEHVPHHMYRKGLHLLRGGLNLYLYGPAGTGKSTIAEDWAKGLKLPFGKISLTAGVTEAALTVRLLPLGDSGRFVPVMSPFLCRFGGYKNVRGEDGAPVIVPDENEAGLFCFDEVDAMDPNCGIVLNSATGNGDIVVEQLGAAGMNTHIVKHPRALMVACANTVGTGMDLLYAGRQALDAAFLDRFYPLYIGYDSTLESRLIGTHPPQQEPWQPALAPTDAELRELGKWCLKVRETVERMNFRRVVGTRMIQKALAARRAGIPTYEVKNDLLSGWKADEKAAVMGKADD